MADNDPYGWNELDARPGFPRLALGLACFLASLAVGIVGWLVVAISDRRQDAVAGWLLFGVASLGLVVFGAVVSNRNGALPFSIMVSATFVVAGVAAVILIAAGADTVFVSDLLLIGGIPVVAGLITGALGLRARRMSSR